MSQDNRRHSRLYSGENMPYLCPANLSNLTSQPQEDFPLVYQEHDLHLYDSLERISECNHSFEVSSTGEDDKEIQNHQQFEEKFLSNDCFIRRIDIWKEHNIAVDPTELPISKFKVILEVIFSKYYTLSQIKNMVQKYHQNHPANDDQIKRVLKKKWKKAEWIEYLVDQLITQIF